VNQLKIAANAFRNELAIEKPRVALMPEKASYMDPILKYTIAMLPRFGLELAGVWRPSPAAKECCPLQGSGKRSALPSAAREAPQTELRPHAERR